MQTKDPKMPDAAGNSATAATWAHASDDPSDPVHSDAEGWWFWDEIWVDRLGPYANEAEARAQLRAYADQL